MIVVMKASKAVLSLFQKRDLLDLTDCVPSLENFSEDKSCKITEDVPNNHTQ